MKAGVPKSSIEVMLSSLAESTIKQYNAPMRAWYIYCTSNNYNVFEATEKQVLEFLTKMFEDGASYGTLNTARSAVSLISKATLSESRDICRFFKGLFKLRPTKPRYNKIWSTEPVLQKASELYPLNSLSLENLTNKLVILLPLAPRTECRLYH